MSAVATELLLRRPVPRGRALSLTLKELVVSGVWSLTSTSVPGRLWGSRTVPVLGPGAAPVPDRPPLRLLDAALRRSVHAPRELSTVVPWLQSDAALASQMVEHAQADLVRRGLLQVQKKLVRTVVSRTPQGDGWCGGLAAQRHAWLQALQAGGPGADAALAEMALAPGLVPLLDAKALRDVDRAVRRQRGVDHGNGDATVYGDDGHGGAVRWGDLCDVDGSGGFGGLDGAFGSVDSGSGFDSGGSFDSGGGGDGGGGGGD